MKKSSSQFVSRNQFARAAILSRRAFRLAPAFILRSSALLLALFAFCGFNPQSLAATDTFINTSGNTLFGNNWNGTNSPPLSTDIALFTGAGGSFGFGSTATTAKTFGELQFTGLTSDYVLGLSSDAVAQALTLNGVSNLTLNGVNVGIDMSTLSAGATQDVTIGNTTNGNDSVTVGAAQTWLVGNGVVLTIDGTMGGTVPLTISGGGTVTLSGTATTASDTFSSNFIVNGSQLNQNVIPSTTAGFILNSGTLSTPEVLAATNFVTLNSGSSVLTESNSSALTSFAGSGSFSMNTQNTSTTGPAMFDAFGGVAYWTATANQLRGQGNFIAPWATLNFEGTLGSVFERNRGNYVIFGAVAGTANSNLLSGESSGSGIDGATIGTANTSTTWAGFVAGDVSSQTETAAFAKVGTGTLTLTATSTWTNGLQGTYQGTTGINGGTVQVNYNSTNAASGLFASTTFLSLAGASLILQGNPTGTTTQTVSGFSTEVNDAGTGVGGGGGSLIVNPDGGTSTTLNLGGISSPVGSTLNIEPSTYAYGGGSAIITTTSHIGSGDTSTTSAAASIYSPHFTYGTDWLSGNSAGTSTLTNYTGYNQLSTSIAGGTVTTNDELNNVGSATLGAAYTTNTLKIVSTTTPQTLSMGGFTLALTAGGLLYTGNAAYTIGSSAGDGVLTGGAANELIVQNLGTGGLTINSDIQNGSGASALTLGGPGVTTLAGVNTYTGTTYLGNGTTIISAANNLGGGAFQINNGTLEANGSFTLPSSSTLLGAGGGTIDVTNGNTLTINSAIANQVGSSTSNNSQVDFGYWGPLIKTDAGTLVLGGANSYDGETEILGGVLSVSSLTTEGNGSTTGVGSGNSGLGASSNNADALLINGGSLMYTGAVTTTDRNFTLGPSGGTIDSEGSGALTFSNTLAGLYTGSGNRTLNLSANSASGNNTMGIQLIDASSSQGTGKTSVTLNGASGAEWTLSNPNNTYTGATTINSGNTLALSAANNSNISTSGTINDAGTLNVAGLTSSALSSTLILGTQTLTGAGSITGGALQTTSGSVITPGLVTAGDAGTGTLSLGNLTISANGTLFNFGLSSANTDGALTSGSNLISAASITLSGSSTLQLYQPGTTSAFSTPGTYDLFQYTGTLTGTPSTEFGIGSTINGADSYTFSSDTTGQGNFITLTITQLHTSAIWATNGSSNWNNGANWTGGIPQNAGDTATFGSVITAPATVTLDANESVGGVSFNNANTYTIAGSDTLTLDNQGSGASVVVTTGSDNINVPVSLNDNAQLTVASGQALVIGGAISSTGTQKITINGAGTVALLSANSYGPAAGTVGTTISAGTVQFGNNSALSTGDVAVTGNSTLQAGGPGLNLGNNIIISSGVTATVDDQGNTLTLSGLISQASANGSLTKIGAGTVILTQNETYGGTTTISNGTLQLGNGGGGSGSVAGNITDNANLSLDRSDNYSLGNSIAGTGGLNQIGADNVTLTAANTFSGTTVVTSGSLSLGNGNALQDSTLNYAGQGGVFDFGTQTSGTLGGLTGSENLALLTTGSAGVALYVGNNNNTTVYSGALSGTGASLTKVGSGNLTLSGDSTYTGATNVSAGTLIVGAGGSINGGAFNVNTGNMQVNGGSITASAASNVEQGQSFTLNSGTATFGALTSSASGGDNALIQINGGLFTASSVSMARTANLNAPTNFIPPTIPTSSGFVVTGGTANLGSLAIAAQNTASGGSADLTGGVTTVTGNLTVGDEENTRWNYLQAAGGTLTVDGMLIVGEANTASFDSEVYINGSTVTANAISDGLVTDGTFGGISNLVLNAGTLYVGSGGIVESNTSGLLTVNTVFSSGTVGAIAAWSTSLPVNLNSSAVDFQAADSANNPNNIALNGVISGGGGATVSGAGTVTLSNVDTYSGATTVASGGTLSLTGTLTASSVTNNGTLNESTAGAVNGASATFTNTAGTATLAGVNGYTGATAVNGGAVILSGSLTGTASTTVAAGATLEVDGLLNSTAAAAVSGNLIGTGSINGANVSGVGSNLDPGLTFADVHGSVGTLASSQNVAFTDMNGTFSIRLGLTNGNASDPTLGTGGDVDQLVMNNGTFTLDNTTLFITEGSLEANTAFDTFFYVIVNGGSNSSALTGIGTGNDQFGNVTGGVYNSPGGFTYDVFYGVNANDSGAGNDIVVEVVSVPEPGTWASLLGGMGILVAWQRSRRRRA